MADKEEIQGVVKAIRKDGKAVCISNAFGENWYMLADHVKPNYIKINSGCKATIEISEAGEAFVTFIKCDAVKPFTTTGSVPINLGNPVKSLQQTAKESMEQKYNPVDESMARMSAIKASSLIFEGTGKVKEFKELSDECMNWIVKGMWVSNEKVPVQ